jgi:glycosyltransferase involved in cell wall biosynthesis
MPDDPLIFIVLLYYDRPAMLRDCLASVREAGSRYGRWYLAVHDDSSPRPAEPIVQEVMGDLMDKVIIYHSEMTLEEKKMTGGLLGRAINYIIQQHESDVCILLCDDDQLHPDYLANLGRFFREHPDVQSCYSNVLRYDPLAPGSKEQATLEGFEMDLNQWKEPINGCCKVDASQVAWRTSCCKDKNCWFRFPMMRDHDASFFDVLYQNTGPMVYTGFIAQYKGIHDKQLGKLKEAAWDGVSLDR